MKVTHLYQQTDYSCGAACFSMLTGVPETEAREACKTTQSGTHLMSVARALEARGVPCHYVWINGDFEKERANLIALSHHFPLIASGKFEHRYYEKGRARVRHHAVVIANGLVLDPGERHPIDLDAYEVTFNKKLTINAIVVVDRELDGYGKNNARID